MGWIKTSETACSGTAVTWHFPFHSDVLQLCLWAMGRFSEQQQERPQMEPSTSLSAQRKRGMGKTHCSPHQAPGSGLRHLTFVYCFQWKLLQISCFNTSFLSFLLQNFTITDIMFFKGLLSKTLKAILPLLLERVPKILFSTNILRSPILQSYTFATPSHLFLGLFLYWSTWIFSAIPPAAPTITQVSRYSSIWDDSVICLTQKLLGEVPLKWGCSYASFLWGSPNFFRLLHCSSQRF